jgi:capsular polysaccharide biosynthesis protein
MSITQAINQDPTNDLHFLALGNQLQAHRKYAEAIRAYSKVVAINSRNSEAYESIGDCYSALSSIKHAISFYIKSLTYRRINDRVYEKIADLLIQMDRHEEAGYCRIAHGLHHLVYEFCPEYEDEGLFISDLSRQQNDCTDGQPQNWKLYPSTLAQNYPLTYPVGLDQDIAHGPRSIKPILQCPKTWVVSLHHGYVFSDPQGIIVANKQQHLLRDFSIGDSILIYHSPLRVPQFIDGKVAFLGSLWGETFYHWMVDVMGRVAILLSSGMAISEFDYLIFDYQQRAYQREILEILDIPEEKVISSVPNLALQAETLVAPTWPGGVHSATINFIKDLLLSSQSAGSNVIQKRCYRKIFVSREKAQYRRILNENQIWIKLEKVGFEKVILEDLSLQEQANLFAGSEFIIAPHGGGLSNLMFCRPGTFVLEIFAPDYVNPCYWQMASVVGLQYFYLLGEPRGNDFCVMQDIQVDQAKFEKMLQHFLHSRGA